MSFKNFDEFYPYYLSEHDNVICRRLHFVGSWVALLFIALTLYTTNLWYLLAALISGYLFAWIGHFFFEHNKPATFQYPFYSFAGDWVMFTQILTGKVSIKK